MELREGTDVPLEALLALYEAVGWTAYTRAPEAIWRAVANSTWCATLWEDGRLIGLVRVLSDEVAMAWLQDVLVHPEHQRRGLGRRLVEAAQARFAHVRTLALMTDDEPRQQAFYRSLGLGEIREAFGGVLHCYVRMSRPTAEGAAGSA